MADNTVSPADGVFVNCPFDDGYAPLFRALTFAIRACRFVPRSARELDDGGQVRIEKLHGIIAECRYGVHGLGEQTAVLVSSI